MRNRFFFCALPTIAGKNHKNPVSGGDEKPGFYDNNGGITEIFSRNPVSGCSLVTLRQRNRVSMTIPSPFSCRLGFVPQPNLRIKTTHDFGEGIV
jgi:hypothetical protein